MGMKLAIVQKDSDGNVDTIDYFENKAKGVSDFLIILNQELIKNKINIQIGLVRR